MVATFASSENQAELNLRSCLMRKVSSQIYCEVRKVFAMSDHKVNTFFIDLRNQIERLDVL